MQNFTDVFISYGRKESKVFATKLYNKLLAQGYSAWFDQNDIPLGVDYQAQIDDGIDKAHNFIFIIAPHAVSSPYCLLEVELALKRNKRIIPILQVENFNFDKLHPALAKINWIYSRQALSLNETAWEKATDIDDFEKAFLGLIGLLEQQKDYVQMHTLILQQALNWEKHQKTAHHLLTGKERIEAEKWLLTEFLPPSQPPCLPADLQAEFVCESKKNAGNLMTDVFISYDTTDSKFREEIKKALEKHAITSWLHNKDIQTGMDFETAISKGIEQADNFLFFISEKSLKSAWCLKELSYASELNKRIIPLLIGDTKNLPLPLSIKGLQYIDFTDNKDKSEQRAEITDFQRDINDLIRELHDEASYYNQHKVFLTQAIKWDKNNRKGAFLLRGYNLQNAQTFLTAGNARLQHKPTKLHEEFIHESIAKIGQLGSEVFISYSRNDGDFARKLNNELQLIGKTTWFDQESIATGANFQKEIYRGIENSDNLLFVISPKSITSSFCEDEVSYAASLNKRFVSILLEPLDTETMEKFKTLPSLSEVQWIDFYKQEFTKAFYELLTTLDTDKEHVQLHTKYSQRATDWHDRDRTTDMLLHGSQLKQAQGWLQEADSHNKHPEPTDLVREYITISDGAEQQKLALEAKRQEKEERLEKEKADALQQSLIDAEKAVVEAQKAAKEAKKSLLLQKKITQRQHIFGAVVTVIALIALVLSYFTYKARQDTAKQRDIAELQKVKADSNAASAKTQKERAESLFIKANERKREAEHNAAIAVEQTQLAEHSLALAKQREKQILEEKNKTAEALTEAKKASAIALENYELALQNEEKAKLEAAKAIKAAEIAEIARRQMEQREEKIETMLKEAVLANQDRNDLRYAESLKELASYYDTRGEYALADSLYQGALVAHKKAEGEATEGYAKLLTKVADAYFEQQKYELALQHYLKALQVIKEVKTENSKDYAAALNIVGITYNRQHKFAEAEKYMLPAAELRKKIFGETSRNYGVSVNDIGLIYLAQAKYDKAIESFSQALEIERINKAARTSNYATMAANLASTYKRAKKFEESEKLYLEVLDIRKEVLGVSDKDYFRTLEDLGLLAKEQKDVEKAAKYYLQAIELKRNVLGEKHPQYSSGLNYLGLAYYELEDYEKAKEYFKQAIAVEKANRVGGESHAIYLSNFAMSDYNQKKYAEAVPNLLYVAEMYEKLEGKQSTDYVKTLNDLGNAYYGNKQFEQAEKMYLEAANNEKIDRGLTKSFRSYITHAGMAAKERGNNSKAILYYEQAAETQKKLTGEQSVEYAFDLNDLANLCYKDSVAYLKAGELYEKAATIQAAVTKDKTSQTYLVYRKNLALFYYNKKKDYEKARPIFEEVAATREKKGEDKTASYASDLSYIGGCYYSQKNILAIDYYNKSADIYDKLEDDEGYVTVIRNLADFYQFQLKDFKKAEPIQQSLKEFTKAQYEENPSEDNKYDFLLALRTASYSQLMNGNWAACEKNANTGQELAPTDHRFAIRLAFVYCFTNRFEKGKAILEKYKKQQMANSKKTYQEVYKEIWEDLRLVKQKEVILNKIKAVIE
jgi:tetratricopeptide (TPR) repeat protein